MVSSLRKSKSEHENYARGSRFYPKGKHAALVSGQSHLSIDSDFSNVECALKHQQRLYLLDNYIPVMEECP